MQLSDSFGRTATDLRLSLTDRCNLRCTYCMPAEGLDWLPSASTLTDDEVVRLAGIAVTRLGVTEIRLTGGEPALRPGLVGIVRRLAMLSPRAELSMTTNGVSLRHNAEALRDAGLNRVNVSLDTLSADRFARVTRRHRMADVIAGLHAAKAVGLSPVKVNAVLLRGVNDDEAPRLLRWCLERGYQLRFIEQMPLDPQHCWDRASMVTAPEILASLTGEFDLVPLGGRGSAPAEVFEVDGGPGTVGVIGSVTAPFCAACDRIRLTSDGQVRNCLFAREETDLRTPTRAGADDAELARIWADAVRVKRAGHGIGDPTFRQPDRPMSAIGG
jgi:cyclic pyranopterin phosphate synthase